VTGPDRSAGLAAVAAPLGAGLALLPEDLGERAMLGDAGANALGAMLGAAAAQALSRPARAGLLAGIVALTVASEKISFTKVIEGTPALRWLDMLGRRPVPVGPAPADVAPEVIPARPDAAPVAPAQADGVVVPPLPGRRGGRHRRVESGASRDRSITRFFDFSLKTPYLKTPAQQEP
jgi:hypothetical protein